MLPWPITKRMWFRCVTFYSVARDVLNNTYCNLGRATARPPRSPDLNPVDFYAWGYLKATFCWQVNVETLHKRIVNGCHTIRNTARILNVFASQRCDVHACNETKGGHVQDLL